MKKVAARRTSRAKWFRLSRACLLIAICAPLVLAPRPFQQGQNRGKPKKIAPVARASNQSRHFPAFSSGIQSWNSILPEWPGEKLEPRLQELQGKLIGDETVPVIVQFAPDSNVAGADPDEVAFSRAQTILESGGRPQGSLSNLSIHTARVTRDALQRLAQDPRIARISIDHPVSGSSVVKDNTVLWANSFRVHTSGICGATAIKWFSLFVDPYSMTDSTESTLAFGETGQVSGLRVGRAGSWFYPPY